MGDKPNKVHGKKSLKEILGMVDSDSATAYQKRFKAFGVDIKNLDTIAPIVDFNNMPIKKDGEFLLGVGSGYVFKGLAERDNKGKVSFPAHQNSELFVLAVMELWLEALHGKKLLSQSEIIIHPIGCKRNYTPDDQELDVNIPTTLGGVCIIDGGGNTGSTTKSSFIAKYIIEKMQTASAQKMDAEEMRNIFPKLRKKLAKTAEQIPASRWEELSEMLNKKV